MRDAPELGSAVRRDALLLGHRRPERKPHLWPLLGSWFCAWRGVVTWGQSPQLAWATTETVVRVRDRPQ